MKKIVTILLVAAMAFSLMACAGVLTGETKEETIPGVRAEFKEAMDDYEAFYDEYCDFMKKYTKNPADLSLLAEYATMTSKLAEMDKSFKEWDQDEMSEEEIEYYLEVSARITKKMADVLK